MAPSRSYSGAISTPKRVRTVTKTTTSVAKKKKYSIPTSISMGRQSFPKQLRNTMRYTEEITTTGIAGAYKYLWSANGMYDPNITGTGHQPLYFDQIALIYDHYTVLKSRMKITFGAPASITNLCVATIYIDDDTSVKGDALVAAEMPGAKTVAWIPSAGAPPVLYLSWDASKTFGPSVMANDNLQGSDSANPYEQSYFSCHMYDYAGTVSLNLLLYVEIEFDVVWDEHKTIAAS